MKNDFTTIYPFLI